MSERRKEREPGKGFVVLLASGLLFTGTYFLYVHGDNAMDTYERTTFVFKQRCQDIPVKAEAYFIQPYYLNVEGYHENFKKNCELIQDDDMPYECPVKYDTFKKYIEDCEITNREQFKRRILRPKCPFCTTLLGMFLAVISASAFGAAVGLAFIPHKV